MNRIFQWPCADFVTFVRSINDGVLTGSAFQDLCCIVQSPMKLRGCSVSFDGSQPPLSSMKRFSNLRTSSLKVSTSCQQSSGRLSFSRKQFTTLSLALATLPSSSRTCFRSANRRFKVSMSRCTVGVSRSGLLGTLVASRPDSQSPIRLKRGFSMRPAEWASGSAGLEGGVNGSLETASEADISFCEAWAWSLSSSEVTRDWICRSRSLARVESV